MIKYTVTQCENMSIIFNFNAILSAPFHDNVGEWECTCYIPFDEVVAPDGRLLKRTLSALLLKDLLAQSNDLLKSTPCDFELRYTVNKGGFDRACKDIQSLINVLLEDIK